MVTVTADAQRRIDAYLAKLRSRLRGIDEQDIRDIVEELRSHILEETEGAREEGSVDRVGQTLDALGSPEQLAGEYLTDNQLARAEVSRSPVRILGVLFRWASLSTAGFLVFLCSILGYGCGFTLAAARMPRSLCGLDSAVLHRMVRTSWDGGSYRSVWPWVAAW